MLPSVHPVTFMCLDWFYNFKGVFPLMCVRVCLRARAHVRKLLFSQCSCASGADLSVLRQRKKIGKCSRT